MTPGSEYEVSSMTWHQWHQTAESARRTGLSWAFASANASSPHWCHSISWARLGRGEKWNGVSDLAIGGRPFQGLALDFGDELRDEVVAAEGGDQVDAGALLAAEGEEVARHRLAFAGAALLAGAPHPLPDRVGDGHPRNLLVEELRVSRVVERQHADDDGQAEAVGLLQEALQHLFVEDVLGDEEVGAGLRFAPHQPELRLQRVGVRVAGGTDEEVGLAGDRLAGPVHALV